MGVHFNKLACTTSLAPYSQLIYYPTDKLRIKKGEAGFGAKLVKLN